ncbi:MAG: hypothetical protein RLZZ127_2502 [Planctomycetota bacterium]
MVFITDRDGKPVSVVGIDHGRPWRADVEQAFPEGPQAKTSKALLHAGFLVTIPVDLVTFPLQFIYLYLTWDCC